MYTPPCYVVQTWYIETGRGRLSPTARGEYYRIELAPHRGAHAPRLLLATRDLGVYQDALDAEGHNVRLVARYHVEGALAICDELLPAPVPLIPDTDNERNV